MRMQRRDPSYEDVYRLGYDELVRALPTLDILGRARCGGDSQDGLEEAAGALGV